MIRIRSATLLLLLTLLSTNVCAHGLGKVDDKEILFKQHGTLLVKAEMTPNSVNYNTDNSLYISIIDQEAGRYYQGEVIAALSLADMPDREPGPVVIPFDKGVHKTRVKLAKGGSYQLRLDFKNKQGLSPLVIDFQLEDNRLFARTTLLFTLAGFFILIAFFVFANSSRRRNSTNTKIGRSITCDI